MEQRPRRLLEEGSGGGSSFVMQTMMGPSQSTGTASPRRTRTSPSTPMPRRALLDAAATAHHCRAHCSVAILVEDDPLRRRAHEDRGSGGPMTLETVLASKKHELLSLPSVTTILRLVSILEGPSRRDSGRKRRKMKSEGVGLCSLGSTNGIGMETARVLARRGVHVVMAVRNLPLGYRVQEKILKEPGPSRVDIMELDLSSMASIRKFASEFKSLNLPLNILINNAGVSSTTFALSKDGIEMQFATNYLGHFLLANLLLDKMKETTQKSNVEGRIINVSSLCHRRPYREGIRFEKINDRSSYDRFRAYGQSKLANILHSNELTRRLKEDDAKLTANSVHPGAIPTNITSHNFLIKAFFNGIFKIIGKNIHQGAATTCYVALHPDLEGVSGKYFADCNLTKSSKLSQDEQLARKLWDYSMKWIGD